MSAEYISNAAIHYTIKKENTASTEVADQYENCSVPLGHGTYGYVEKWKHKSTNKFVAVKTIDVSKIKAEHGEREIKVWQQIKPHENVVPLLDSTRGFKISISLRATSMEILFLFVTTIILLMTSWIFTALSSD